MVTLFSLREALRFWGASITGNVALIPDRTILFKTPDIHDFTLKTKDVLDNLGEPRRSLEIKTLEDNTEEIIMVHERLFGGAIFK
jgi:hypothetical protein